MDKTLAAGVIFLALACLTAALTLTDQGGVDVDMTPLLSDSPSTWEGFCNSTEMNLTRCQQLQNNSTTDANHSNVNHS